MLSKYHIENHCVKLPEKEDIRNIEFPIVVVVGGRYFICTNVKDDCIFMMAASGKTVALTLDKFLQKWNGALLTLKKSRDSIEPDYGKHYREQRVSSLKKVLSATCAVLLLAAGSACNDMHGRWWWYAVIAVDLAGLWTCCLLLQQELHLDNNLAERLCGLIKGNHCEDVTKSEAADFLGLAKLSEIGTGFFAVNLLILFLFPGVVVEMAIIAAAVLPFTFWSVWYQKFRARSWCVLCLLALALMWLQAGTLLAGGLSADHCGIADLVMRLILLAAAYGLTILAIGRGVKIIGLTKERDSWRLQYNTLKADEKVIEAFEKDAQVLDVATDKCSGLVFGNTDAERRITIFSNPYCSPCATMHERIKDMPADDCCVQYVLTCFSENLSDINRYFIAAYQQLGQEQAWQIMTGWYAGGKGRGAEYFKNLGLDTGTQEVKTEYDKHLKWRAGNPLPGTPTVLLNGREIVRPYMVEDYVYIPVNNIKR